MTSQVALVLRNDPERADSCVDSGVEREPGVNHPLRRASDLFISLIPGHDTFTERILKFLGARHI
jgi:hypothetical protein